MTHGCRHYRPFKHFLTLWGESGAASIEEGQPHLAAGADRAGRGTGALAQRKEATRIGDGGVADDASSALPLMDPPAIRKDKRLRLLRDLRLLEQLRSLGLSDGDLYALQSLLRCRARRALSEVTKSDIDEFVTSLKSGRDAARKTRRRLYRTFDAAGVSPNPVEVSPVRRAPRIEEFPPAVQHDLARFLRHVEEEQRLSRSFKKSLGRLVLEAGRWHSEAHPSSAKGLAEACKDDAVAKRYMEWCARPLADGRQRSERTFEWGYTLLRHLWLSAGLSRVEVKAKRDELGKKFNSEGDPRGRPNLLNLRAPDPEPMPSIEEAKRLFAHLEAEVTSAKAAADRRALRKALTVRALVHVVCANGYRAASLVGMRADLLRPDADNAWSAYVPVKGTPTRRRRPPTPRDQIGDQQYARWPLYADVVHMIKEMLEAHGLDLLEYVRSGKREALGWVALSEDESFGRLAKIGEEVAPLWLSWDDDRGYLRLRRIEGIFEHIVREVLGRPRGRLHIFRRFAAFTKRELSVRNPALVESLIQMSPQMQLHYSRAVEIDLPKELGTLDPFSGLLSAASFGAPDGLHVAEDAAARAEAQSESPELAWPAPSSAEEQLGIGEDGRHSGSDGAPSRKSDRPNPATPGRRGSDRERRTPTLKDLFGA